MAKYYDTLLSEYLKNPGQRGIGLDALAEKFFAYKMISYDDVTSHWLLNFKDVDVKSASIYSGEDVYMTHKIYKKQKEEKLQENKVLQEIELPLLEVLKQVEIDWVKINRDKLKEIGTLLENEIATLEKEIYTTAGEEFNINSPKQVGEILFDKLWMPTAKKTKTGYSVNSEVLEWLARNYPIAAHISEYRHYKKILWTYIEGLLPTLDDDDKIHTSYNQAVTTTGRLSSTSPNLQNIPTWEWIAGEVRAAFIPYEEDDYIACLDYSQVEVRILAHMSGDENLINAFKKGIDIHYNTAKFIFWKENISGSERKIAKAVNFWVIYWISAFWLSAMLWIPRSDAQNYINKFYENYPKVRTYYDGIIENCEKNGYVETLFWRRRYINGISDKNRIIKGAAEREAINMPIQWTSADVIKLAMIQIYDFLKKGKYKSNIIMQVHDELVFNVKKDEKDKLLPKLQKIMEEIIPDTRVPLIVDCEIGKNWKDVQ